MKSRFTAIDVAAVICDLKKFAVGRRLTNVYDLDGKTYLFKLSGRSKGKGLILVESGIRIHMTNHDWSKSDLPNGFSMKLRKHLRGSLLFSVNMLITSSCLERVIDFDFGKHRLIVELYDHGNILLTTDEYIVVYALRPRPAVGQRYPTDLLVTEVTSNASPSDLLQMELNKLAVKDDGSIDEKEQLRRWLPKVFGKRFGGATVLIEHSLAVNGLDGRKQLRDCCKIYGGRDNFVAQLCKALSFAEKFLMALMDAVRSGATSSENELPLPFSPCILLTHLGKTKSGEDNAVYEEFSPFQFAHICSSHDPSLIDQHESFSEAVDEFFWKQEDSKLKVKQATERDAALKRVENVRRDHESRIKQLQDEADAASLCANLLEQNLAIVDRALGTVRTAATAGLAQSDIEQLLLEARIIGDPTAVYIHKLELDKGLVKLLFGGTIVDAELSLTGILNTEKLWSKRRTALEKMTKTVAAAQVAIKNAERSVGSTASKAMGELDERARTTRAQRKTFWFEQFAWFVSSDGRLVIAGRDHQQNELLVRRYMASTDIFVHCELHGAGVVLVKTGLDPSKLSTEEKLPPPPSTLREAAIFAVARSMAWQEGTPAHAYWVWGNQVSKTPQTGEFVTPGAFIIRGKRNILPLEPLVLGLGVVFVTAPSKSEGDSDVESDTESDSAEVENTVIPPTEITSEAVSSELNATAHPLMPEKVDEFAKAPSDSEELDVWAGVGVNQGSSVPTDTSEVVIVSTGTTTAKKQKQQQRDFKDKPTAVVHERPVTAPSKPKGPVRGQKGKMKKMKDKYADQDEEEREARMALLQSAGAKRTDSGKSGDNKGKKKGGTASASVAQPEYKDKPRPPRESFQRKQEQPVPAFVEEENETEQDMKNRQSKERNQIDDALHRFVCDPVKKVPLVRIFSANSVAESIGEADEDSSAKTIIFALPMCAPYPTLSRCSFKVKIVPGKTKRGKVARAAVEAWQRQLTSERQRKSESSIESEQKTNKFAVVRSMIKAVVEDEWSRNMPQSCKLMLSGAAQAAATERTKRKQQARKKKQAAAVASKS